MQIIHSNNQPSNDIETGMADREFKRMPWVERNFFAAIEGDYLNGLGIARRLRYAKAGIIDSIINPRLTRVGVMLRAMSIDYLASPRDSAPFEPATTPEGKAREERNARVRRENTERWDAATDANPFYFEEVYAWGNKPTYEIRQKDEGGYASIRLTAPSSCEAAELVKTTNRVFNAGFTRALGLINNLSDELRALK
jgi:hypothetical protein